MDLVPGFQDFVKQHKRLKLTKQKDSPRVREHIVYLHRENT
jgi:hypothetical protein